MPAAAEPIRPLPAPIGAGEFAAALEALGPFEAAPHLAVAVSGGGDSLALAHLARTWTRARRGWLTALVVDHGLRPEAAREARQVGQWLAAAKIEHRRLSWRGDKPSANLQAAARAARYGLLADWCRRHGVLHLLLAHHQDDQAETLLLRLARGTGVDGLAAMAPVACHGGVRLLRPLLDFPKARLLATLRRRGLAWLEDPSNAAPRFRRSAARRLIAEDLLPLAADGLTADTLAQRLAATAARMRRARAALDAAATALLAAAVELSPHGFARFEPAALAAAPQEIALRVLARLVMCIGGSAYPPRHERLVLALGRLGAGFTLGGCRFAGPLIWREPARIAGSIELAPGRWRLWDGRYRVRIGRRVPAPARVAALGTARPDSDADLPRLVWPALPALFGPRGLVAVPALGVGEDVGFEAVFAPEQPLGRIAFHDEVTIYR